MAIKVTIAKTISGEVKQSEVREASDKKRITRSPNKPDSAASIRGCCYGTLTDATNMVSVGKPITPLGLMYFFDVF